MRAHHDIGRPGPFWGQRLALAFALALPTAACSDDEDDVSDLPAEDVVFSDCDSDEDCVGGRCIAGIGTGLCTTDCLGHDECPDGTLCVDTESTSGGVCLFSCSDTQFCTERLGPEYACDTESDFTTGEDVRVCIDSA